MKLPFHITLLGIEWNYKGDWIIWLWPWRRGNIKGKPFVSLSFSGTGEWGDARYASLAAMDKEWEQYDKACELVVNELLKHQENAAMKVLMEAYTSKISTI